jgi:SpoIID/LytB domain protein
MIGLAALAALAALVGLVGLLGWPAVAAGATTVHDEVGALYSSRFGFDRRGVPLITVRIMEGQTKVTLSSASVSRSSSRSSARRGVALQPHGTSATEVTGARAWTVRLKNGRPARARHWVVLERMAGSLDRADRAARLRAWKKKGLEARTLEVGTLFAVGGRVVDHRTTLVVTQPDPNEAVARARARRLKRRLKRSVTVHRELLRRPHGTLVARPHGPGSSLRVVNRDVFWFAPQGKGRITVKQVEFGKGYRWHGHRDRSYFGRIYVTVDRAGKLAVVNEVPADHLLFGLVPAEIYTSAPLEALKAQAVAARGQLLAKIGTRHTTDPYLICSAQHCQVYSGVGREHRRTSRAVRKTRGLILVDRHGRLADTVYSANAGGFTEHNEHVWHTTPNPNLRGHLDAPAETRAKLHRFAGGITEDNLRAWLSASPPCWSNRASVGVKGRFRWTQRIGQKRMNRLVRRRYGKVAGGVRQVRRLQVLRRGVSGRAVAIRLHVRGRRGRHHIDVEGELTIRRLLGNLKSAMFVVDHRRAADGRTDFVFRGGGWGHGVGMCQTGAIGMAEARRSFRQILHNYYRKTKLLKLY